jgi:hypothetical protein
MVDLTQNRYFQQILVEAAQYRTVRAIFKSDPISAQARLHSSARSSVSSVMIHVRSGVLPTPASHPPDLQQFHTPATPKVNGSGQSGRDKSRRCTALGGGSCKAAMRRKATNFGSDIFTPNNHQDDGPDNPTLAVGAR